VRGMRAAIIAAVLTDKTARGVQMKIIRLAAAFVSSLALAYSLSLLALSAQARETDTQDLLLHSISKLDVSGVKAALDKGANPNWVIGGHSMVMESAEAGAGETDEEKDQKSVEILQMLFKAGAKVQPCDEEILSVSIIAGKVLFTEALLKDGLDPSREVEGMTPMEVAAAHRRANIIELLKEHGVPALDPRDAAQQALIGAAEYNDIPRMEKAINDGADVSGSNRQGKTALVEAGCQPGGGSDLLDYSAIMYLLQKGADPAVQGDSPNPLDNGKKTTALHCVIAGSSFLLNEKDQKRIQRSGDGRTYARLIIESLLRNGGTVVSARDWRGQTPLHVAALYNNLVAAKALIEAGCKIMPRDNMGKTPLDYAESAEMIKLLKDQGAKEE
jgi:ankyrin repeat protein